MRRRLARGAVLATVMTLLAGLAVAAAPAANAVATSARLEVKGPGSLYDDVPDLFHILVKPTGSAAVFSVAVRNTGSTAAQFNVLMGLTGTYPDDLDLSKVKFTVGAGTDVTSAVLSTGGWFTGRIGAGQAQVLTVSITLPKLTPVPPLEAESWQVVLRDTARNYLTGALVANIASRTTTHSGMNAFVTTAGQSTVADPYADSEATPLKPGGKATYTVKLENKETGPTTFTLQGTDSPGSYCPGTPSTDLTPTIKAGSADVTAAVLGAGYTSAVVKPGASVTLTVTVSAPTPAAGCHDDTLQIAGYDSYGGPDGDGGILVQLATYAAI